MFSVKWNWPGSILRLLTAGAFVLVLGSGTLVAHDKESRGEKETVKVELEDTKIDMKDKVEAGTIVFEVENNTESEHSFGIKGEDLDEKLEGNVAPGATRKLEVSLSPGVYKVYCPVDNHEDSGVWMTLAVVDKDD